MKKLQDYKLNNPDDRYRRINTLIEKFQQTQIFEDWGIKINSNFTQVRAKTLGNAEILDNKNAVLDWMQYEKMKVPLSQPISMNHETWALVYSKRDFDNANALVDGFKRACGAFGIKVQDPQYVECTHDRNPEDYINPIKNDVDPSFTTLVVVLLA